MSPKRTGTPAWVRLGKLLEERRAELSPEYYTREVFARERKINLRLVQDLENNTRENFTPVTQRDVIAPAYGITYESIMDVLHSPDADLAAAPGTPPRRRAAASRWNGAHNPAAAVPPESVASAFSRLDPDVTARATSYVTGILVRRGDWRTAWAAAHPGTPVAGIPEPSGADLFEPGSQDARSWDLHAAEFDDPEELAWLVGRLQARRAAVRDRETGAG